MIKSIVIKTPHVTSQGSIVQDVRYTPAELRFGADDTGTQVVQVRGVVSHTEATVRRLPRHVLNPELTFDQADPRVAEIAARLFAAIDELARLGLTDQRLEIEAAAAE